MNCSFERACTAEKVKRTTWGLTDLAMETQTIALLYMVILFPFGSDLLPFEGVVFHGDRLLGWCSSSLEVHLGISLQIPLDSVESNPTLDPRMTIERATSKLRLINICG